VNLSQLQALASSVGFPDANLAAAVAMAESKGNPSATAIVTDPAPGDGPERSFGLWQINTLAHPSYNESLLLDPTYNAQAAFAISSGGQNWKPWSTFTKGYYRQYYAGPSTGLSFAMKVAIGLAVVGGAYIYVELTGRPRWLRRALP
jgi:hypothetical protein